MADKIKVSKWFDEWITEKSDYFTKNYLISLLAPCEFHDSFIEYCVNNHMFGEKQYQEIRDNFEDYVRAILDGNYEVEVEEEKTPIGWIPEEYEEYWIVQNVGEVTCNLYDSNYDKKLVKHTKVFKTKEEAEFEAEKMKVTRELEKYASEFRVGKKNWSLYVLYNSSTLENTLELYMSLWVKEHGLIFESEEKAQEAIKAVGEDRILKYYFGVENE